MGKNAKLGIAAAVVAVVGLLAFMTSPGLGLLIIILGVGVIVFMLQKMADDEDSPAGPRKKGAKSKLDNALEARRTTTTEQAPQRPSSGGLPTWNPTALDSWQPPSLSETEQAAETEPAGEWDTWDSWSDSGEAEAEADTMVLDDQNPLDALDRLDEIDPIAEVERLDALSGEEEAFDVSGLDIVDDLEAYETEFDSGLETEFDSGLETEFDAGLDTEIVDEPSSGSGFSFTSAPAVINEEEIRTDDDIMAASHATELEIPSATENGDSELARLLAKVQARLSAYE